MPETVNLCSSLRSLYPEIPAFGRHNIFRQIPSFSQPRKFLCFPEKIGVFAEGIRAVHAIEQDGTLQELDDSPVSVEPLPICGEDQFDRVMADAQELGESVVIVWMAAWCRKCIYLKPKLEKLAAEYYPRLRFYHVDVNAVPYRLVSRAGVTKMPTIQVLPFHFHSHSHHPICSRNFHVR
ncbi:PREDICTED: thioredoxin-like 3-2, chloroplastic isoform X3 [Tarenaya hassleriana]|uniref:thioredoxin-like 3-2, chloroplastic isoform X3 n=1 Tax=Tarenaya hassleriana TaxID=28532 RepID=UPI0008FD0607|nr:PREDICTED: thioredoxin-like 3-2, chloroplastic isoform X3 [Tarenaya hassleriana]